jgi:chromosome segregation ATPase
MAFSINNLRKLKTMSDLQSQVDFLTKEKEELQTQLQKNGQGVNGLLIQLDAYKSELNESLTKGLQLKTQAFMLQKQNNELTGLNTNLQNQVNSLSQQLIDATARIESLEQVN